MPTFFGTQSLNQFQPIQIGGGTASTGPQQPGSTQAQEFDYDKALQILARQMEPPEVPDANPSPIGQKILAGIADALLTYASVRMGGPATTANTQRLREEEGGRKQAAAAAKEQGRRERNALRVDVIKGQLDEIRIRERQQIDDARTFAQQDKAFVSEGVAKLQEQGFKLPDGIDPDKMTRAQFLRMKDGFFAELYGAENGPLLSAVDTVLEIANKRGMQGQVQFQQGEQPTIQLQTVKPDSGGKGGEAKRPSYTAVQLRAILEDYGIDGYAPEFLDADGVPDAGKINKAIAAARVDFVPLPRQTEERLSDLLLLQDQARDIREFIETKKPGASSFGFATEQDDKDFRSLSDSAALTYAKMKQKGVLTDQDFERMTNIVTKFGKLYGNNLAASKQMEKEVNNMIALMTVKGRPIPLNQIEVLRNRIKRAQEVTPGMQRFTITVGDE